MGILNNVDDVLHRIKINLHPNYLPKVEGRYVAKTDNEATLSIGKICAVMKNRGGFTGSYETLIENVRQFLDECAYQLCDGYALNLKYYSIHPNIGGTFESEKDSYDKIKNPVSFRFRPLRPLTKLIDYITVEITGIADSKAYIDQFINREDETVNDTFTSGDMFCIMGNKIKIAGNDPSCGVYFVPVDNPSGVVKVERIGENNGSMITGIAPVTQHQKSKLEIRTQYTGSNVLFLKAPRTIIGSFVLNKL